MVASTQNENAIVNIINSLHYIVIIEKYYEYDMVQKINYNV